jgi:multidrug efflux system membrane fusion protein
MNRRTTAVILGLGLLSPGLLSGCEGNKPAAAAAAANVPTIAVSEPVQREVTDFVDFTGRTDAVEPVNIRARVTGYLTKIFFREGGEVKQGDQLFEIDPRPYQAQLDQALSQVDLNEASLKLARATYERDRAIAQSVAGGVSRQQLDQDLAAVDEASARLKAARASTEVYKLNLEFTRVTSPIDGLASRYYYTRGNLVIQDQTLLTTVVSIDPIYAYFDMDEPTLLRIRRAINDGRIKRVRDRSEIPIWMGLQGEDGYPHRGAFNFINNVVNPSTGSIQVRGKFDNPRPDTEGLGATNLLAQTAAAQALVPAGGPLGGLGQPLAALGVLESSVLGRGARLLTPGMFVRIRLPIGQPHPALLVIDRAISSDQGIKYLYVLDAEHKVQYRRVKTGALQLDGLRVIEDGLQPGEWVAVGALQQLRPRMEIRPDPTPMPSLAPGEHAENEADKPQPPPAKKRSK